MFRLKSIPSIPTLELIRAGFNISLSQFFTTQGEPVELDPEQLEMLNLWNRLAEEQKQVVLELLRSIK